MSVLVTNFSKYREPIYREAIEKYGDSRFYISYEAFDVFGDPVKNSYSLRMNSESGRVEDLSSFWRIFDSISRTMEMIETWKHEKKYYWWYITDRMKKVVYMGEAQKEHTVQCTNATMIKIG